LASPAQALNSLTEEILWEVRRLFFRDRDGTVVNVVTQR